MFNKIAKKCGYIFNKYLSKLQILLNALHYRMLTKNIVTRSGKEYIAPDAKDIELAEKIIKSYKTMVEQSSKYGKNYLYHDNSNRLSNRNEIESDNFPVPKSFSLISKTKSVWYGGRNPTNRFVEYLFEKERIN